jgi:hypothetical protein
MKRKQFIPIVVLLFVGTVLPACLKAQGRRVGPVPEKGFWEVVSNIATPKEATVQFYDLERHLIYQERVVGVKLDLSSRRTCRRLNRSLQVALLAWEEHKQLMKDKGLVAMYIK